MQIKLIFTRKVLRLTSFWMWDFLELENGLINWELSDVLLKCDHKRKRTMHTGTLFAENCFFPDSAYDCIIYWEHSVLRVLCVPSVLDPHFFYWNRSVECYRRKLLNWTGFVSIGYCCQENAIIHANPRPSMDQVKTTQLTDKVMFHSWFGTDLRRLGFEEMLMQKEN